MFRNKSNVNIAIEKYLKICSIIVVDIISINVAFLLALYLHYEGLVPTETLIGFKQIFLVATLIKLLLYNGFKLYNSLWEYASIEELIKVVGAVIIGNIAATVFMKYMHYNVYAGIYLVTLTIEILLVGGTRFSYRFFRRVKQHSDIIRKKDKKNILIIGSGATATLIAREIKDHFDTYGQIVGFIDDDEQKMGKNILGLKILGNRHDIYSISKRYTVNEIILVIPTVSRHIMGEIVTECKRTSAKVRIVPGITEIIDGKVFMSKIRDVNIEDLLGRDPVDLNLDEIAEELVDKIVLVTGGGGSIGSELCRQIARFNPKKLMILDIYENNAYDIQNELRSIYGNTLKLEIVIASVRDRKNIFDIVRNKKPHIIFHAAAHKHVPLMEYSPKEAIKNNTFGTMNVAEAAHKYGVEKFVLISTDKAVNPTNVMGASKRICEMIIQGLAKISKTNFVAVRFGNVLGSNGSVVPLFKKQIEEGGPVTVTHKDIIRYFMTIPEAAQLVIQASAIAKGGEIFVLDMGEPVRIYDLAVDLIKLSGLTVYKDINIKITGLRPGEKLYEELLMNEEDLQETIHKKIFIGKPSQIDYKLLKRSFERLKEIIENGDCDELRKQISHIVPTYKMSSTKINNITIEAKIKDNNLIRLDGKKDSMVVVNNN